ncbi:MAG TPA: tripartite tricarboxylate transporter substrate binding protein [Ramlibacter sp.]|nr:tripartite tricarboxylate transporter substrate binding protein [Ramlibacter sp.]
MLALAVVPAVHAQQPAYPNRPITFITPFAPGNAADILVRGIAQEMTRADGVPVAVESRPGAATFLAAQAVTRAQPDGYTILVTGYSTFTSNRFLFKKLPYDPVKDFQPVTTLARGTLILMVGPSVHARNLQELIAQAKQQPGKFSYAEATAGTRVAAELFQRKAGITLNRIPYKTSTQAIPDLMSGLIDMTFTDMSVMRQVKEGRLRALAVADTKRNPLAPEIPTMEELGVKDMESMSFTLMMAAPAGTPMAVVEKLRAMVTKAGRAPSTLPIYANGGTVPFYTTPAEMSALIERESKVWADVVKAAGMEPQ